MLSVSFLPTADCRACSRASTSPSHSRSRRRASAPSELTFLGGREQACGPAPVGTLPPALGSCLQKCPHSQVCQQTREPGSEWRTAGPGPGAWLHPRGVGAPRTPRGLSLCSSGLYLSGTSRGYPDGQAGPRGPGSASPSSPPGCGRATWRNTDVQSRPILGPRQALSPALRPRPGWPATLHVIRDARMSPGHRPAGHPAPISWAGKRPAALRARTSGSLTCS